MLGAQPEPEDPSSLEESSLEQVSFGDFVYLHGITGGSQKSVKNLGEDTTTASGVGGYLHADRSFGRVGFQTEGEELRGFEDCLFQLIPQLNFDSVATKNALMRRPSFSGNADEQEMVDIRIKQESDQNEARVKKCEDGDDKELLYGNVCQLKHVPTGKFLKGNTFTASMEKDCLK
ncbi:hypothetical protein TeGR_g14298, partial [Tetraparma gracilis]